MKQPVSLIITFVVLVVTQLARAQDFNSGSNGSYGPMVIAEDTTLDMPADGIFHCTTITVNEGATLTFNPNPLNTPVYLLAQGDVVIEGTVNVSGKNAVDGRPGRGGPGGFPGGYSAFAGASAGHGHGPGNGKSWGTFASVYGNALIHPMIGGSGGDGRSHPSAGSGGGGALLIASTSRLTVGGSLIANGGELHYGSGGAIRLVSPLVEGAGSVQAVSRSGHGLPYGGRVRIDTLDRFAFRSLAVSDRNSFTFGAQMFVFPPIQRTLEILQVGEKQIPENAASAIEVSIPSNEPLAHSVTVRATNFEGTVPIEVQVVPENGPSKVYTFDLEMNGQTTATGSVDVDIPTGMLSSVYAWTRGKDSD